jgi:hypothetical protein
MFRVSEITQSLLQIMSPVLPGWAAKGVGVTALFPIRLLMRSRFSIRRSARSVIRAPAPLVGAWRERRASGSMFPSRRTKSYIVEWTDECRSPRCDFRGTFEQRRLMSLRQEQGGLSSGPLHLQCKVGTYLPRERGAERRGRSCGSGSQRARA